MLTFLLVVHAIVTATLVGVILMQRSEGGGLGMGGSPTGLMSARGAADFLTRATTILASLFVGLSIVSAVIASRGTVPTTIDTSLAKQTPAAAPEPVVPLGGDPLAAAAGAMSNATAPAPPAVQAPVAPSPVTRAAPKASQRQSIPPAPPVERPSVVPTKNTTPSIVPAPKAAAPVPVGPPANSN